MLEFMVEIGIFCPWRPLTSIGYEDINFLEVFHDLSYCVVHRIGI